MFDRAAHSDRTNDSCFRYDWYRSLPETKVDRENERKRDIIVGSGTTRKRRIKHTACSRADLVSARCRLYALWRNQRPTRDKKIRVYFFSARSTGRYNSSSLKSMFLHVIKSSCTCTFSAHESDLFLRKLSNRRGNDWIIYHEMRDTTSGIEYALWACI